MVSRSHPDPSLAHPELTAPELTAFYAGRRILVTGAAGFLGRHLCAALAPTGAQVIPLTRADGDLTQQTHTRHLITTHRPHHILHCAAACGGIAANLAHPAQYLHDNTLMGLNLLEAARHQGAGLTLISTTCAYPEDAPLPLSEATLWHGRPTPATAPYGLAKRLLHEAIATYRAQYSFDGITLIPANLYGPGDHFAQDRSHVVAALIRRFVEATDTATPTVTCWGTGDATREFLHVRDAAHAILLATARHHGDSPINLGTGIETPIRDLATMIASAASYPGQIRWDVTKPQGQPRRVLDPTRARALGIEPRITLRDGIAETVAWYRASR